MSDLQAKRGRPKKISPENEKALRERILREQQQRHGNLDELQYEYLANEYSQKIRVLISNIPAAASIPLDTARLSLMNILEGAAKTQMISELELTAASLLLSRLCESVFNYSTEEVINTVYFVVKMSLETNQEVLKMLYEKLSSQFRNFPAMFKEMRPFGNFSLNELNTHYNELYRVKGGSVNYMYYVDDILRLAPPYITKKAKKLFNSNKILNKTAENLLEPELTEGENEEECCKVRKIEKIDDRIQNVKDFTRIEPLSKIDIRLKCVYAYLEAKDLKENISSKVEFLDLADYDTEYFLDLN